MRRRIRHQLAFDDLRAPAAGGRGGWRPRAGRPRGRRTIQHDVRDFLATRFPVLATWRLVDGIPSLRRDYLAALVRDAVRDSHKPSFATVEFSVQTSHLHFIIEATDNLRLARGMQGLAKRLTLRLNRKLDRRGSLFATRYHSRILKTPREVKHALRYVLLNARHHLDVSTPIDRYWVDPYSSGPWFDGWAAPLQPYSAAGQVARRHPRPTCPARTWLLRTGWRRWGLLAFDERPGPHKPQPPRSRRSRTRSGV